MNCRKGPVLATAMMLVCAVATAELGDITAEQSEELKKWVADNPREGGTLRSDWLYDLPEGVTTKDVTYYSDEIPCYAKIFYPTEFSADGSWPAIVLGHGYNAKHYAIEKHAARFAERGLVAMVIDYRSYGMSGGYISLDQDDPTTDDVRHTEVFARIKVKRTRLLSHYQVEDYRNAISYIQGEPGVDPERIGTWGSSHSGGHQISLPALDARVKVSVGQVPAIGGHGWDGKPRPLPQRLVDDAILRAREGQGAEIELGFSFRGTVDLETQQSGSEYRPFFYVDRIPESVPILLIYAEKEELFDNEKHAVAFAAAREEGETKLIEVPHIGHFQIYSGPAYEIAVEAAAAWYIKHLGWGR
jgi:hypothetical protein